MLADLRFAVRTLLRQPAWSALAVAILALGLGAATAMFSIVDALMLRPLPFPEAERLVRINRTLGPDSIDRMQSPASFLAYRDQKEVFAATASVHMDYAIVEIEAGPPDLMYVSNVSQDYFQVFPVRPRVGRLFLPEEFRSGAERVLLLSAQLWTARFGADPAVVGRKVRVGGELHTIVGVAPPELYQPVRYWSRGLMWRPVAFPPAARNVWEGGLRVFARLQPGVPASRAQSVASAVAARLESEHPTGSGALLTAPQETGALDIAGNRVIWLSLGLGLFVLLIACINLAGVQLARLAAGGQDLAVRVALGAGRGRLVRQLVTENLLLSVLGGVLSIPVAHWCADLVGARMTFGIARAVVGLPVAIDLRVLGFALLLVLVTAVVVGTVPAWLGAGRAVAATLRGGRGSTGGSWPRLRQALVVTEMALALVLLAAGGLFVSGLQQFVARDPGWTVDGLLTTQVHLRGPAYQGDKAKIFYDTLEQRLLALPGVEGVAIGELPLWENAERGGPIWVEGTELPKRDEAPRVFSGSVNAGYFHTAGIRLREGRLFTPEDRDQGDPVIINEAMASQLWPRGSAIGRRFASAERVPVTSWYTVVGVVSDVRPAASLGTPTTRYQVYQPLRWAGRPMLAVRTTGPPEALASSLRRVIAELDPSLPRDEIHTAQALVERGLNNYTLIGWTLFGFAGLGLVLSALGVYGLFTGWVLQRTREIGVRVALGAQSQQVLGLILGKGLRLALLGGALGIAGAMLVAPLLNAAAPELPAHNPGAVMLLALLLVAVAAFACWLPARRAAHVDPMVALRSE